MLKDHVERVRSALLPLCEPLHDVFALAEQLRQKRLPELVDDPAYRWHGTHTIRALSHYQLSQMHGELGAWSLVGNHAQNGALWMSDGTYRARVLHAVNEGDVPPPGVNRARLAFYSNPPLAGMLPLFGEVNDKLLILWRIDSASGTAGFRVVRPIGERKWGTYAKTDLDFILPETAEELADLTFEPTDEDLGLELPGEEEGNEDAGGITG